MNIEHQRLNYQIPAKLLCKNHRRVKIMILSSDFATKQKVFYKKNQDNYKDCVDQIEKTYGTPKAYENTGYQILKCKKITTHEQSQTYISKKKVQNKIKKFFQQDEAQVCMLFLFGHGAVDQYDQRTYYYWCSNGNKQYFSLDDIIRYWTPQKIRRLIIIFQGCYSGDWHEQIKNMPNGSISIITSCQKYQRTLIHYHKISLQNGQSTEIQVQKKQYEMGLTTLAFYMTYEMEKISYHPKLTKYSFDNSIYKKKQKAHMQYDLNNATLRFFKNTSLNFSCLDKNYQELQPFPKNNLRKTTSLYSGGNRKTSERHKGMLLKKIRKKHFMYEGFFNRSTFHGYGRYSTFNKEKYFNFYSQYVKRQKQKDQIFDNSDVDGQVLKTSNQYMDNEDQYWTFIQNCKVSLPEQTRMKNSGWQFSLRLNKTRKKNNVQGTIYYSLTLYDLNSDFKTALFRLNIFNKRNKGFGAYKEKYKANLNRTTQYKPKLYLERNQYTWLDYVDFFETVRQFASLNNFFCEIYNLRNTQSLDQMNRSNNFIEIEKVRYQQQNMQIIKPFKFDIHNKFGKGNFMQRVLPIGIEFNFANIYFNNRNIINLYSYYVFPGMEDSFQNFYRYGRL